MTHLLSFLLLFALAVLASHHAMAQEPAKEPDAISKRLTEAKDGFVKACEMAHRELLDAIESELQTATSDGNLERVKKLMAIKDSYLKEGLLPTEASIHKAKMDYDRQFREAKAICQDAFAEVVADCTKSGDIARASLISAEGDRWEARVKARKTPKTRYKHPVPPNAVVFNGHRYAFFEEAVQWPLAKKKCEELDGYLVVFETKAEADFIRKAFADKGGTWMGLTNADPDRKWRTIHGDLATYLPWGNREPHPEGNEHEVSCGFADGLFHDSNRRKSTFICEWDE